MGDLVHKKAMIVKDSVPEYSKKILIAAVGDLSFRGDMEDDPSTDVFSDVASAFKRSNLAIGNLESPLTPRSAKGVPGKCCLRGSIGWARVLKESGIGLVSLANNHMMDFGPNGLFSTIQALEAAGVKYVGAGENIYQACKPIFMILKGLRVCFLARSMVVVSSPSYAGINKPGVAFFDLNETREQIRACKTRADIVILLLHWGLERYSYPTPTQRKIARQLINTGVDIIFGSHPHVLQGVEALKKKIVFYSMGNFLFFDFKWSFIGKDGALHTSVEKLNSGTRRAGIFYVTISEARVSTYEFVPTVIAPDRSVKIDRSKKRIEDFSALTCKLRWPAYSFFWRLYSIRQEWKLRIRSQFFEKARWSSLRKVRLRHIKLLFDTVRRSGRIVNEKSTNPYE